MLQQGLRLRPLGGFCHTNVGDDKSKSKRYCKKHQNAFDNTRNDVVINYDENNPTKDQEAFFTVFGTRNDRCLPDVANKIVSDYCSEFPEEASGGRKAGKKRGSVALSSYVISEGVKKAKVDISSRRKMDFDFFVLQCKQLRE